MSPQKRIFPEPEKHSEHAHPGSRANFSKIATKVFSTPKAEIDEREKQWDATRKASKHK